MEHEIENIVCSNCFAINRFPKNKLTSSPKCGKCSSLLFQGKPANLNDATFLKFTQKTSIPVVVDFWAEWCGPCKMMAPIFLQAAQDLEPEVIFGKLDTEKAPLTASEFGIRSIPTIAIFVNGQVLNQRAGAMSLTDLKAWIQQTI